jgi:hypothetical protein
MENLTANQRRVVYLVRFLCNRDASEDELSAALAPNFNVSRFRFQLLIGDECAYRWPQVVKAFARYAGSQRQTPGSVHKIAHELSVVRRDLEKAQTTIDSLQGQILEMLKQVDNIARVSGSIRETENRIVEIGKMASALQEKLVVHLAHQEEA